MGRLVFPSSPRAALELGPSHVGKRSRSERRRAGLERAVRAGDAAGVRALCERNPRAGAKALIELLERPSAFGAGADLAAGVATGNASGGGAPSQELLSIAATTSARLRADREFELALRLSSLCRRLTPEIRLEEAVAAFARGEDDRVREICEIDDAAARALTPLLSAVHGGRVPTPTPASSSGRRALLACCRAVSAVVRQKPSSAKVALSQVPSAERARFFASELLTTANLSSKRTCNSRDLGTAVALAHSSVIRNSERAKRSLAMEVARRAPAEFLAGLADRMELPADVKCEACLHAACATAGVAVESARVSLLIAKVGAGAFPEADRGAAALYEGFAFIGSDRSRAGRAFDMAIGLGADMGDALRGRWLLAGRSAGAPGRTAEFISAATRFLHFLEREPSAGALAATVANEAGIVLASQGETTRAIEMIGRARSQATAGGYYSGALASEIDLTEAGLSLESSPARSREIVDSVLCRDPNNTRAWELRASLAEAESGQQAAEDVVLEAARLNVSHEFVMEARRIRAARGERIPLKPGTTTAGELAAEWWMRLQAQAPAQGIGATAALEDDFASCRRALGPVERAAFDAAHIAMLAQLDMHERAAQVVTERVAERDQTLATLSPVFAAAATFVYAATLANEVSRWVEIGASADTVFEFCRMLLSTCTIEEFESVLFRVSRSFDAKRLRALEAALDDMRYGEVPEQALDPQQSLLGADRALAPDFSLRDIETTSDDEIDFPDVDGLSEPDPFDFAPRPANGRHKQPASPMPASMSIDEAFQSLERMLDELPPDLRARSKRDLAEAARLGPSPKGAAALRRVVELLATKTVSDKW